MRLGRSTLAGGAELSYRNVMQTSGFEEAFAGRIDDMLDACTRCGACFTACPIAAPAGLADADPESGHRWCPRPRAHGHGTGSFAEMGQGLHAERSVHPGLRLRRQSAVSSRGRSGADGAACERAAGPAKTGRAELPQNGRGRRVCCRGCSFRTMRWSVSARSRPAALLRKNCRTWCSTPAAMCSRRPTSRFCVSTFWTRSA